MDNKKFWIISAIGALGGLAAFFTYFESRKRNKLQEEVLAYDKQIKQLDLLAKRKSMAIN